MVRATCGVPVTVAASSNSTVTSISSPAMKTPFAPSAAPASETPVTAGPTSSGQGPNTAPSGESVTAWRPRSNSAALPAASAIDPPFSASAEAPTLSPFVSRSSLTTV